MSIYKDNVTGKWRVVYRYTDWTGKTKQTSKRGFPTNEKHRCGNTNNVKA